MPIQMSPSDNELVNALSCCILWTVLMMRWLTYAGEHSDTRPLKPLMWVALVRVPLGENWAIHPLTVTFHRINPQHYNLQETKYLKLNIKRINTPRPIQRDYFHSIPTELDCRFICKIMNIFSPGRDLRSYDSITPCELFAVSNLHNSRKGLKRPPVTMGALFTRFLPPWC